MTLSCKLCLTDALQIVRDCEHSDLINAHGELEVDFDVLTDFTLWHLYDFTKRSAQTANGVANDRPTQASPPTMRAGSMPRALMDELVHRLVHLNESDMNGTPLLTTTEASCAPKIEANVLQAEIRQVLPGLTVMSAWKGILPMMLSI